MPPAGRFILEVTAEAWRGCLPLQQLSDAGKLRGIEVELVRAAGGPRKPVVAKVLNDCRAVSFAASLPPAPDTKEWLAVLFKPLGNYGRQKGGNLEQEENRRAADVRQCDASHDADAGGELEIPLP
jgi:hypothetical protein